MSGGSMEHHRGKSFHFLGGSDYQDNMGRKLQLVMVFLFLVLKEPDMSEADNMGRKLLLVMVFYFVVLKEPNMPEAVCRYTSSGNYRCKYRGLTSINMHQNLLESISDLDLSNNKITEIPTETSNKPESSGSSESVLALIGLVCTGSVAFTLLIVSIVLTIWCKRNTRDNSPSGPNSTTASSVTNTTPTVSTSGRIHDQTGQGQSLVSTQPLNINHPLHITGPTVSQPHYYVDEGTPTSSNIPEGKGTGTGEAAKAKSHAPSRDDPAPLTAPCDDDEPTYVEPDGAIYMTPEDVLYEIPANSHCEESVDVPDNLHYYQPLKKDRNLPTDAAGYIVIEPKNPKRHS
ncbi:hypothetical protein Bbelb_055250 [Branchiostoma belcheri]|nr:hypothetical protein Bbelb_055250 [Branchiostoma belcheri]